MKLCLGLIPGQNGRHPLTSDLLYCHGSPRLADRRQTMWSYWAKFAAQIPGEGERQPVEEVLRLVVVLDLDAIVGVNSPAIRDIQVVVSQTVVVGNDVHPRTWSPFDLPTQAFPRVG